MLDGGSKSEGMSVLLLIPTQNTIFGGKNMKQAWSWLKCLNRCKTMKTLRPAVGKLHRTRLKLNGHSVSQELLLT